MRFSIGGIFAKCSACGADEFHPALPLTPGRIDVYVCTACRSQVVYAELITRIGKEAVRRAGAARAEA